MKQAANKEESWLDVATRNRVVVRSVRVSLVVGTILVAINHGNVLLGGGFSADLLWKIPLTYLVPYSVSTYASVDAIFSQQRQVNAGCQ